MTAPAYWEEAKAALSACDPTMAGIINAYQGEAMNLRGDAFFTLARSITGQQISVKAAESVWKRLEAACAITPKAIANADSGVLRACGLSTRKVLYLHALANYFLENGERITQLPVMADEAIIKELTAIHGIGRWTVEMFLIFHLGRPDVLPLGDIGLLKGVYRYYNNSEKMPLADVTALAERWRPWRSVATWYFWRALDPVPLSY